MRRVIVLVATCALVGGVGAAHVGSSTTGALSVVLNPATGAASVGSSYTVTATVTDDAGGTVTSNKPSGNSGTADTTPPSITCPAPITAEASQFESAVVNVPNATASDDSGVVVVSGPAGTASYPLGTTEITFTAVDQAGN